MTPTFSIHTSYPTESLHIPSQHKMRASPSASPLKTREGTSQSLQVLHLTVQPPLSPTGRGLCMAMERTYIMAKPDAVQRGLVSDIIGRFEKKGYKLVALKLVKPARSLLEEHYDSLKVREREEASLGEVR